MLSTTLAPWPQLQQGRRSTAYFNAYHAIMRQLLEGAKRHLREHPDDQTIGERPRA
jgi:hypothetical protein